MTGVPPEGNEFSTIAVKRDQYVWARSPVRLDLAGGWTDTPPYTLLYGGKVVNAAVNLNGQPPVQVFVRKTADHQIRVQSIDLGIREDLTEYEHLRGYDNPGAPFALARAALVSLGLSPERSGCASLREHLRRMGGGLDISLFVAVPKGSGLGTSSILGGTILGALHRILGQAASIEQISREVLRLEEMVTTGGGWQDQVGGLAGGVKYSESAPASKLSVAVEYLDDYLFRAPTATACLTLYYTGITRLAKDILDDVVARVRAREPEYLALHEELKLLASDMRSAISKRDIGGMADLVSRSWEANKRVHPSTTNDEVDALLARTRPHYRGAKLLGAGGGGYCLFVSESQQQAGRLRAALEEISDESARIVDFSLNREGLEVSVS